MSELEEALEATDPRRLPPPHINRPGIPQHSSKSNEHFTPPEVIEAARALMGGIDLDPASCEEANRIVKADEFWSVEHDGLAIAATDGWHGRVFLNPPGGKMHFVDGLWRQMPRNPETGRQDGPGTSSAMVWWNTLVDEWEADNVTEAVFVCFTLEMLRLTQRCHRPVQFFPRCVPRERLRFSGARAPTNANVIVYLPSLTKPDEYGKFKEAFGHIGLCERAYEP